jgi:hypothetical protein
VKLRLDADISFLDNPIGHLSIDAMDLFKLWFSHFYIDSQQMYITHPHLWDIVKKLVQIKRGIRIECVAICPKEIGSPIVCQGPHNPNVVCLTSVA